MRIFVSAHHVESNRFLRVVSDSVSFYDIEMSEEAVAIVSHLKEDNEHLFMKGMVSDAVKFYSAPPGTYVVTIDDMMSNPISERSYSVSADGEISEIMRRTFERKGVECCEHVQDGKCEKHAAWNINGYKVTLCASCHALVQSIVEYGDVAGDISYECYVTKDMMPF